MIDINVYNELIHRGIITHVGLNPENFNDINDLIRLGAATETSAIEQYEDVVNEISNSEEAVEAKKTFLELVTAGGAITLDVDYMFDEPIVVTKDVTIDLNGHTLGANTWDEDGEANSYVFWVKSGKLTLTGAGKVVSSDAVYSMAIWANGGDVEINGGVYKNGGDSCDLIYASKKGNIVIIDGEFVAAGPASGKEPGTKNPYSALNVKDANRTTCTISVKGGKFYKFDPANNLSEGDNTNFVAEGFISVKEGNYYVVHEAEL